MWTWKVVAGGSGTKNGGFERNGLETLAECEKKNGAGAHGGKSLVHSLRSKMTGYQHLRK